MIKNSRRKLQERKNTQIRCQFVDLIAIFKNFWNTISLTEMLSLSLQPKFPYPVNFVIDIYLTTWESNSPKSSFLNFLPDYHTKYSSNYLSHIKEKLKDYSKISNFKKYLRWWHFPKKNKVNSIFGEISFFNTYHLPLLIYHLNYHLRYSYFTTLKTTENLRFSGVWGVGVQNENIGSEMD